MRWMLVFVILGLGASPVHAQDDDQETETAQCAVYSWSEPEGWYDSAVSQGEEERTWFLGPSVTDVIDEPYEEDGYTHRPVKYWEKGRWECTPNQANTDDPDLRPQQRSRMTWGHLARELMTGQIQVSNDAFEDHEPSEVHIAGDPGADVGPTYRTMGQVMDGPARQPGDVITDTIHRNGTVTTDDRFADEGVTADEYIPETDHTVANVFWDFMTGTYLRTRYPVTGFAERDFYPESIELIGFPTTEAYWTTVPVAGADKNVLVQCFERRCLTYTPDNPDNWQVEMGNIGMHYWEWRYGDS